MCVCVRACMHVCVAKPVAVELRCHATALIIRTRASYELQRDQQNLMCTPKSDQCLQCPHHRSFTQVPIKSSLGAKPFDDIVTYWVISVKFMK